MKRPLILSGLLLLLLSALAWAQDAAAAATATTATATPVAPTVAATTAETGRWVSWIPNGILQGLIYACIGFPIVWTLARLVGTLVSSKVSPHVGMIARKLFFYFGCALLLVSVLMTMGVQLGPLLGTAGIGAMAIGFASQTSLSNLISGLFLLGEKPFQVGDVIRVGGTTGTVLSIDLLSVKIRTADNLFVRLPNESLIKAELTTITRFPIRRLDVIVGVAYKEDLERVMAVLRDIVDCNPWCLDEPEPLILIDKFNSSSIDILVGAWFEKNNLAKLKNSLVMDIKRRFDDEGIEIPFPHVTVFQGGTGAIDASGADLAASGAAGSAKV